MNLRLLDGRLAICRLAAGDALPPWVGREPLISITRTARELSLVLPEERVPSGVRAESGWVALELEGPIPFTATGVLASLLVPLADAGVPVFALSTFDTDYVLIREENQTRGVAALETAGHRVAAGSGSVR